jgi:glycosyltransferase involved in cell wall biosynthesis
VVSWLLPVRDGARWLGGAVRSALAECGPDDEVIVVDDGSVDDPGGVLPLDPRVRLVRSPPVGIAAALEIGRALCRGTWIARLDADDEALPGRIAAQVEALEADPALASVGGRARLIGPAGEGMERYVAWVNGLQDPHPQLLVESPLFHPAVTLRASAIAAVGGWRSFDGPEDYDLWLRLADAGWRLANVPADIVALRDRPDRLTRTDLRYRTAAFRALKMGWLAPRLPRRVAVWGAGKAGRPWIRWLLESGHVVPAVFDIRPRGSRHGVPVLLPETIAGVTFDHLLVAVGARGARDEIRARLALLRPDLVEGRDWHAVA